MKFNVKSIKNPKQYKLFLKHLYILLGILKAAQQIPAIIKTKMIVIIRIVRNNIKFFVKCKLYIADRYLQILKSKIN